MSQEFKIIQAQTPLFANTQKMQEILAEEAKAGWDLLEKEDNYRIKLQRNISSRDNDKNLDIDPYRTTVGVSSILTYGVTAITTIAIVSVILYFAIWSQG
jgi:23S rRNA maturation mini-RNase III